MKRAVILLGAGASVEYKTPSTKELTDAIEREVIADAWMQQTKGDEAFRVIRDGLKNYLHQPGIVNFEHIYHCVHELISTFALTSGAVDEFRPLLHPFINNQSGLARDALTALAGKMANVIFAEVSASCGKNPISLAPLTDFFGVMLGKYITRIYTTNYDDFPLQAVGNLYTGFDSAASAKVKRFEIDSFWHKENLHSIFHLHGSVHMGFPYPETGIAIGELQWFDDLAEALKYSSFWGSTVRRMDGSSFMRTAVITGLDKLSRLQARPLSHFYSAMARDLMFADVIFVIGSGLGDLHLNTWLHEARSRDPMPPVLFVDWWDRDFLDHARFEIDHKGLAMFHALNIHINDRYGGTKFGSGWTMSQDRTAAVWDKGFQAFLNSPNELQQVLGQLL